MRLNPFGKKQVFIIEKGSNSVGNTSDIKSGLQHSSRVTDYSYSGYDQVIRPEVDFITSYEYYDTVGKVQNVVESFVASILSRDWYYVDKDLEAKKQKDQQKQLNTIKKIKQKQMAAALTNTPAPDVSKEMVQLLTEESPTADSPGVKQLEEWETGFNFSDLMECMIRDLLVCGNFLLGTTDWEPVQLDSIVGLKRDEYGQVEQFVQQVNGKWFPLPLDVKQYIHVKYIDRKRKPWGVGMFHALTTTFLHNNDPSIPELDIYRRHVQNSAKIEERYASPVVIWAYENIDQRTYEQMKVQMEDLQPGDRRITTRKPELITETIDGRSALISSITPIIDKEIEAGLQSSANRLLTDASSMADAREANVKDNTRALLIMEKVRRIMNEEIIPRVLENKGNIEFVWGTQDDFKIELPQGIADAVKLSIIAKEEAREILRSVGWKLDDAAWHDQNMQYSPQQTAQLSQTQTTPQYQGGAGNPRGPRNGQNQGSEAVEENRAAAYKLLKKKLEALEHRGI